MHAPRASGLARDGLRESLHVAGLWALAVAQPVLDLLGRSPEFFVAHRAGAADVLLLGATIVAVGAAVPIALLAVTRRLGARLHRVVLGLVIAVLFTLLALQFFRRASSLGDEWILAAAAFLGIAAAIAYLWTAAFRQVVTVLALALVLVPAAFLVRVSAHGLLRSSVAATSAGAEITADSPSVILVVFDQFPLAALLDASGSIDAQRYPSLAALAAQATWYPAATSVANKTAWAVPAIVTGVYPDPERRLPSFHDYPESVFSLLADGYALRAHEPVTELCPRGQCRAPRPPLTSRLWSELQDAAIVAGHALMPSGLAARLPPVNTSWNEFGPAPTSPGEGGEGVAAGLVSATEEGDPDWSFTDRWVTRRDTDRRAGPLEFIRSIHSEDRRPTLYFLHALLPHEPYLLLPSGQRYSLNESTPGLMAGGRWANDRYGVAVNYQRFLLQAGYADRLVGVLVERLQQAGLYDDSLLIVTADHGASFWPERRFKDPQSSTLSDILSVPLIVKLPGQTEGGIDPRQAETVDVLPTIADVVGAHPSWPLDGRSLLPAEGPERDEKLHYHGAARGPLRLEPDLLRQQLEESVAHKLRLMGPEGDPADGVLFGPHAELVGQPVDSEPFRVVDLEEEHVATLREELLLSHVEPESDFVPLHLNGHVIGDPSRFPSSELAVAVNGVIRATGRIYPYSFGGREGYWSVVLPRDVLERGYNSVEVFLVIPRARTVLRRIYANPRRGMPRRMNLARESAIGLYGMQVRTSGFHAEHTIGSAPVRWTDGHGTIRVRPPDGFQWRGLEIGLRFVDPRGSDISILVDGCTVYSGTHDEAWVRTFDLGECTPEGPEVVVEIVSSTFEDGPVTRGVGVSSIVPLEELPEE